MAKRDFYDVLGVGKNASSDELNQHIENLLLSTIQIKIQETKTLKTNLKKPAKLMVFFRIKKKNKTMIILDTLLLKAVVEDKVVALVVSVELTFQTFLKIFLEILEVEEDQEVTEAQIIEDQI